jgi:hypothetical protein
MNIYMKPNLVTDLLLPITHVDNSCPTLNYLQAAIARNNNEHAKALTYTITALQCMYLMYLLHFVDTSRQQFALM